MSEIREKVKPKCAADWKDYQVREGGREGRGGRGQRACVRQQQLLQQRLHDNATPNAAGRGVADAQLLLLMLRVGRLFVEPLL